MKIIQLLKKEISYVTPEATMAEVGREIESNRMAAVFVEEGIPIGIMTRRDYIRQLLKGTKPDEQVFRFARKDVVKIRHDRNAEHALAILIDHNIRRLVVVDDYGHYVGIISYDDIVDMMAWVQKVAQLKAFHMLKNDGFLTFSPETTLYECAKEMLESNQNVSVVLQDNIAVGIITESDIINCDGSTNHLAAPLRVVMHSPPECVSEDENIDTIIQRMGDRGIHSVVVTRPNGEFGGVITSKSIAKSMEGNYNLFLEYKVQVLRETLDNAPYMIVEMEKDESGEYFIYWANQVALNQFGQSILGLHPDDIFKEYWGQYFSMFESRGKIEKQLVAVENKAYEFSMRKIYDDKIQITLNDISNIQKLKDDVEQARSDAVMAEEAIRHANAVLYKTLNSIDALIYVIDVDTYEILFVNGYAQSIFGLAFGKICYEVLQDGQSGPCEFCPLTSDPSRKELGSNYYWENRNSINGRWYRYSDRIIKWVDGRKVKIQVGFDITDTKDAWLELETINTKLSSQVDEELQKNLVKDDYLIQQSKLATMGSMLSAITHQWRQPLNVLMLSVQDLLLANQLGEMSDDYLKESVDCMIGQLMHMNSTIDDFRDFYRPKKEKEQFDIVDLVLKSISLINAKAQKNGVEVEFDEGQKEIVIYDYSNELMQGLLNIFNNAIEDFELKQVLNPKIKLLIAENSEAVELVISDNGGGIAEGDIANLFEPFFTTKADKKGTGLGLYLLKAIVQKVRGSVEAKNSGGGAMFVITLPK